MSFCTSSTAKAGRCSPITAVNRYSGEMSGIRARFGPLAWTKAGDLRGTGSHQRSPQLNVLKGLLILLIVVGHNRYFSSLSISLFLNLYSFHVLGFLFLPFIHPPKDLTWRNVRDYLVRYYVPFILFYVFACILYFMTFTRECSISAFLWKTLVSAIVASPELVKEMSGFQMFWFLPALFSLVVFRMAYGARKGVSRYVLLSVFILCHFFVGGLPVILKRYIPFGLHIACYCVVPGLLAKLAMARLANVKNIHVLIVGSAVTLLLFRLQTAFGTEMDLGNLYLYTILQPAKLLLHDALALSAFLTLVAMAGLRVLAPCFERIGKHSLLIYLVHSFVFQSFTRWIAVHLNIGDVPLFLLSLAYTVAVSAVVASLLSRCPFTKGLVTPRCWSEWLPVAWWRRSGCQRDPAGMPGGTPSKWAPPTPRIEEESPPARREGDRKPPVK